MDKYSEERNVSIMKKRILSLALCAGLIMSIVPASAFATENVQDSGAIISANGLCEHHTEHNSECGYAEAVSGTDCTHQHDNTCGYAPATEESSCAHEHTEACSVEVTLCVHEHNENCYPVLDRSVSENDAPPPYGAYQMQP